MLSSSRTAPTRLIRWEGQSFPTKELGREVFEGQQRRTQTRVAILAPEEMLGELPALGQDLLDPEKDYRWSGWLLKRTGQRPDKKVVAGTYEEWFRWYMRSQRFRAFQTVVLVEPMLSVTDKEHGGYIDGFLARLMGKVRTAIIVSRNNTEIPPPSGRIRTKEVLRALLLGTRLSRPEVVEQSRRLFVPVDEDAISTALKKQAWRISKRHPRYRLDEEDVQLVQGMLPEMPEEHQSDQVGQLFIMKGRFRTELRLPDSMLSQKVVEDIGREGWATVPSEAERLSSWLRELNRQGDDRLIQIHEANEFATNDEWLRLLNPQRFQVRRVLDALVHDGRLEKRRWYREIGRPAFAYALPGKTPFLERRCGQCAFFSSAKRRCRLWWLVNKQAPFFDSRWKRTGSAVTSFEVHKMKYASRIGPHSSGCLRFLDKKRDHLRKVILQVCEICTTPIKQSSGVVTTCKECGTKYVHFWNRVKVMTAYEHEYARLYHEITGGDAKADLEAWRREARERQRTADFRSPDSDDLEDVVAEEATEIEPEPPRVFPQYNEALQAEIDNLAATTDIAKQFSVAMAESTVNATRNVIAFSKLYVGDADPLALQEKYLALIGNAGRAKLLPYEALIMKQYWICYGLALKRAAQQWFGPRKRSRFVSEFVSDSTGRARGYSPVDAAINYLHQRRLRQAERINAEVGFPGTCDGFLHKERYNSRKIGLLLDMIDPFKFADREELLLVVLDQGLTWQDFRIEMDRRGSNFYYPTESGKSKLDQVGAAADRLVVRYQDNEMELVEAYRHFAEQVIEIATGGISHSRIGASFVFPVSVRLSKRP